MRSHSHCRYGDIRLINKRPKNVEERRFIGHWEGDLILFRGTKKNSVTTLVERKTRLVQLLKNTTKVSQEVMNKIKNKLTGLNIPCKTITFDQGVEFANYPSIENTMDGKVYYCHIQSPWQRGSNENMNGRLRRYLPRSTDIKAVTEQELDQLAEKMNTMPRKCLGFRTPKELFLKHIKTTCRTRM